MPRISLLTLNRHCSQFKPLSRRSIMKVAYIILFMLLTLNANAGNGMRQSAIVPADSINKPTGLKRMDGNAMNTAKSNGREQIKTNKKENPAPKKAPQEVRKIAQEENDTTAVDEVPENESGNKTRLDFSDNNDIAKFPGGERAVRDFIRKNKRYPEECKAVRAHGKVIIEMTIAPDGTVGNIAVATSSGNKYMDNEAMRVAGLMPKWNAAKEIKNGKERQYRMSMTFRPGR